MRRLSVTCESYELLKPFRISRGTIECITTLRVELEEDGVTGQGECVPSAAIMATREQGREIAQSVEEIVRSIARRLELGADRDEVQRLLPRGPARNAVDCALWDLEAKQRRQSIAEIAGLQLPHFLTTCYSAPLSDPEVLYREVLENRDRTMIKLKLGGEWDREAVAVVREAAPEANVIVDVNGGWSLTQLVEMADVLKSYRVDLIEQPLAEGEDSALENLNLDLPLCADESCHDRRDLEDVARRYNFINIKLDKTGGLTEALALAHDAKEMGIGLMVGCMAGTSLSMAPAMVVGSLCRFVDLDGPLLLERDRDNGVSYQGSRLFPAPAEFWG